MRHAAAALLGLPLCLVACSSSPPSSAARPAESREPSQQHTQFLLTDMTGEEHDLGAALARGETVALVFWQTWCAPCKKEAPKLLQAVERHGGSIRFMGVVPGRTETIDDAEVESVRSEWGYDAFPQIRDRDMTLSKRFSVRGTPTVIVLGRDERVLYRGHKVPADWTAYTSEAGQKN